MLVLSRAEGDGVHIGDNVEVVVLEVKGDAVRLGFRAPGSVRILRTELVREVQRENESAATVRQTEIQFPQLREEAK
ncbi:MAG: carbon storage regulator CsrA [Ilumatobacteraceae bacterium]